LAVRPDAQVGSRIRRRRRELGLSQRALSGRGISYAYISRVESGKRTPSLSALIALAERLETTALYLASGRRDRCPFCGR
jgi:transcriptional regulator with XRE-family HTH domain